MTSTESKRGAESASGFLMLSQTKISIVYIPDTVGVHDKAGENVCPGVRLPVSQESEITKLF